MSISVYCVYDISPIKMTNSSIHFQHQYSYVFITLSKIEHLLSLHLFTINNENDFGSVLLSLVQNTHLVMWQYELNLKCYVDQQ